MTHPVEPIDRARLAVTVDQHSDRLDVKGRASDRAHELRQRATTDPRTRGEVRETAASLGRQLAVLVWWRRR